MQSRIQGCHRKRNAAVFLLDCHRELSAAISLLRNKEQHIDRRANTRDDKTETKIAPYFIGKNEMKKLAAISVIIVILFAGPANAGASYVSGKVTSLLAHGTNPAIRLEGNVSPDRCDGGAYGWLYFRGTAEEQMRIYSTALAMSLAGKRVTVYTNADDGICKIVNIQVTSGLN